MARSKIAVAGATGRVGRHVVTELEAAGYVAVPISRSVGVDVITGAGLEGALENVEAVVDAAGGASPDQEEATQFFTTAARNLHRIGSSAGVGRIVSVSIVGVHQFTAGYGVAKQRHEEEILSGAVPSQVLRATQFHEFVPQLIAWGSDGGITRLQRMRTQPVAARAVAGALVEAATVDWAAAPNPIVEVAGPREENMADLARRFVNWTGDPLEIEEVVNDADPDHELYESGALLPGQGARLVGPTFAEWLDGADAE
jgi:uncharacterized protein YbjT (DUF2867 family)